jgi:phage shock protein PspC (stress-responsive transcriptional regulator)
MGEFVSFACFFGSGFFTVYYIMMMSAMTSEKETL